MLEQSDEGFETLALQSAFVKSVGWKVGGRDHHDAALEKRFEQAAQDHGVGNVDHHELVEAEKTGLGCDLPRDLRQGVRLAALAGLSPGVQTVVSFGHEGMEMDPPLSFQWHSGEEDVHQHRLSAPHRSVEIEPLRRLGLGPAAETETAPPGRQRRGGGAARLQPIALQSMGESFELLGGQSLSRIGFQAAAVSCLTVGRQRARCGIRAGLCAGDGLGDGGSGLGCHDMRLSSQDGGQRQVAKPAKRSRISAAAPRIRGQHRGSSGGGHAVAGLQAVLPELPAGLSIQRSREAVFQVGFARQSETAREKLKAEGAAGFFQAARIAGIGP